MNDSTSDPDATVGTRDQPHQPPERLSRERLLTAALELVDTKGLNALSMRGLGHKLGRNAMSLYRYFPNRAALLDGLVELVLNQLTAASPGDERDWQVQLRDGAQQFRKLALAHPNMAALFITQPLSTPLALRPRGTLKLLEQLLTLLAHAGLTVDDALRVARNYIGSVYGHVLTELQQLTVNPDETDPLLRLGLHRLPRQHFPQLRGAAPQLANYNGATELDLTLDVLLTGLMTQLAPPAGSP